MGCCEDCYRVTVFFGGCITIRKEHHRPPDLKNRKSYENGSFEWRYPNEPRIKPGEWGLSDDELVGGIYTDITHTTPEKEHYGKEHIVSLGVGKE